VDELMGRLRAHPWAALVLVLVAGTVWVCAVRDRHAADAERREWAAGQPPEIVRAGPLASWAAGGCPPLSGACNGVSVGGRVTFYPGTLAESGASIIGEC
jgi:hypothetical protein